MRTQFYANPYAFNLVGFYFTDLEDYTEQLTLAQKYKCSDFEHDVEMIDGETTLFSLCGDNFRLYCTHLEAWEDLSSEEQTLLEHLVQSVGYHIQDALEKLQDVTYSNQSAKDCAYDEAVEMGIEGIALRYFDCEAYARDCLLGGEWVELHLGLGEYLTITNVNHI